MRLKLLLIALLVILNFGYYATVNAVTESSSILITTIPSNPNPGENVDITLSSYSENLNTAIISWFVDGKSIASGTGKKSISIQAPSIGSETIVLAKITLPEEETQVSTIIKPSEMVLLWEAVDSYVPPFYKGKALAVADTFIKVVAIPEIRVSNTLISPKNMTYSWKKDYDNVQDSSGYGRSFMLFKNDYLENANNIGVTATTIDQKYSSSKNMSIGMAAPQISFYKKDTGMGILWENALLENHNLGGGETIVAVPYFISPKDIRRPDLLFRWFINNTLTPVPNFRKTILPLKAEAGAYGNATIRLEIENTDKIFQTSEREIRVEF